MESLAIKTAAEFQWIGSQGGRLDVATPEDLKKLQQMHEEHEERVDEYLEKDHIDQPGDRGKQDKAEEEISRQYDLWT